MPYIMSNTRKVRTVLFCHRWIILDELGYENRTRSFVKSVVLIQSPVVTSDEVWFLGNGHLQHLGTTKISRAWSETCLPVALQSYICSLRV